MTMDGAPNVAEWTAERTEVDTGVEAPETSIAPEPPVAPTAPETPAEPSTADQIVQGLVKSGLTEPDAKALLGKATTPEPIKDALEAYLDGKPYLVPKNLTFKLKSGTQVAEKSFEQLQREGMLYTDYQRKTAAVAQRERELGDRMTQAEAQLAAAKARETWLKEQEQQMLEAQRDPKKWESYQEYMRMYQADPRFRKVADDALKARELEAQNSVYQRQDTERAVSQHVEQARTWIAEIGKEFPGVDPDRVRTTYAQLLALEQVEFSPQAVRAVFQNEAQVVTAAMTPLQQEMAAIKAELEALKAGKAAEAHNAGTQHVLNRSKAPNVAPGGGGPPAPARAPERKPIAPTRQAHEAAVSDWAKVRDQ